VAAVAAMAAALITLTGCGGGDPAASGGPTGSPGPSSPGPSSPGPSSPAPGTVAPTPAPPAPGPGGTATPGPPAPRTTPPRTPPGDIEDLPTGKPGDRGKGTVITVRGQVTRGVEPGCLIFGTGQGMYTLISDPRLAPAQSRLLRPGARLRLTGQVDEQAVSFCQQGRILRVLSARPG
jgi:hypothetical protein